MTYKQYQASCHWVPMLGVYVAELLGLEQVVAFSATTRQELKHLMVEAVQSYESAPG